MREIEFRGKKEDNDEWVYGYYGKIKGVEMFEVAKNVYEKGLTELDLIMSFNIPEYTDWNHEDTMKSNVVIPETVGQFTGLIDKNGTKIFEGDVCKVPDNWDEYGFMAGEIREIYFKNGGFRFKPKNDNENGYWLEEESTYEVVGNIHEKK